MCIRAHQKALSLCAKADGRMHSQIAGQYTLRYVSNVGTLLGSSSLPTQCRKYRLDGVWPVFGGSVAFPAFIGQATCDGEPGNRPIRRATFATGLLVIVPASDPMPSFIFAFVA